MFPGLCVSLPVLFSLSIDYPTFLVVWKRFPQLEWSGERLSYLMTPFFFFLAVEFCCVPLPSIVSCVIYSRSSTLCLVGRVGETEVEVAQRCSDSTVSTSNNPSQSKLKVWINVRDRPWRVGDGEENEKKVEWKDFRCCFFAVGFFLLPQHRLRSERTGGRYVGGEEEEEKNKFLTQVGCWWVRPDACGFRVRFLR